MNTDINIKLRSELVRAKRIVIKIGTSSQVLDNGRLNHRQMKAFAKQIALLHKEGKQIVMVVSGAIGAGIEALGLKKRPKTLPELQIAAAVGQSKLMKMYDSYFTAHGIVVGQVLVTHDDLKNRSRHLNLRNAMIGLLKRGFIPIVNENDVVSVDEIKLGDNDFLSSLMSVLVDADLLIAMTTSNGVYVPHEDGTKERVPYIPKVNAEVLSWAKGKGSNLSTGGMETKLLSAQNVVRAGATVVIADGRDPKNVSRIMAGKDVGTLIGGGNDACKIKGRKKWIAFFHKVKGELIVDDGAKDAIVRRGVSLLPVGIVGVRGKFSEGDLVIVRDSSGEMIAKGLVNYSAVQIDELKGCKTSEIDEALGGKFYDEIINRDNMVLM